MRRFRQPPDPKAVLAKSLADRDTLDGFDPYQLARSFGVSVPDAKAELDKARRSRVLSMASGPLRKSDRGGESAS